MNPALAPTLPTQPSPSAPLAGEEAGHTARVYVALVAGGAGALVAFLAAHDGLPHVLEPGWFLPAHTVLELLAILVGAATFAVHWHAARHQALRDTRALFVGAAFLAMAVFDGIHTMTYKGMPGFLVPGHPNQAIHYWFASRLVLVTALLAFPFVPRRSRHPLLRRPALLAGAAAMVALAVGLDAAVVDRSLYFVDGGGLTPLKIGIEQGTIALALIAGAVHLRRAVRTRSRTSMALTASLAFYVLAGLCFSFYTDVHDLMNLMGHGYKAVGSYLIFDALFVVALLAPTEERDRAVTALGAANAELEGLRRHVEGELAQTIARLEATTAAERQAREQAEAASGRLQAIQRITDATLAPLPLDPLLDELLRRLRDLLRADLATVHLLAQDGAHLEPRAALGLEEELHSGLRIPLGEGIAGTIACRREPLIVEDLATTRVESPALRGKARSLVGAPLLVGGRVIGVIKVATVEPYQFTEEDLGLLRVVADRVAAAIDRARLLAELEATLTSLPDPFLLYDASGAIVRVNGPAQRLLGYAPEDYARSFEERWRALGARAADGRLLPPSETPTARAFRGETVVAEVLQLEPRPGNVRWVSASAAPIVDSGGRTLGAVLTLTDFTHVRELEEHREDLLRTVSHDLRSPLAAIRLQAQRLHRSLGKLEVPDGTVRGLEAIVRGADRMSRMIEDLVESERLSAGKLALEARPVDVLALLAELVSGGGAGIEPSRLDVVAPDDLPRILGDAARIDRIFTNLLTNAFKYSPPTARVRVEASAGAETVEVSVIDQGFGIAPEDLPRLFERWYRARNARADGLGLGLYITRTLVEAHGGRIAVTSRPGEGSTFRVTLPRA